MHCSGGEREMFTNLQTGHAGTDRSELATDLRRCIGLHIKHIDMAGSPDQIHQDHRLGRAFRARLAILRRYQSVK